MKKNPTAGSGNPVRKPSSGRKKPLTVPCVVRHTGPLTWYPLMLKECVGKADLRLKPKEYEVLACLVACRGRFLTAEQIYKLVWGGEPDAKNHRIQNLICNLRTKRRRRKRESKRVGKDGQLLLFQRGAGNFSGYHREYRCWKCIECDTDRKL